MVKDTHDTVDRHIAAGAADHHGLLGALRRWRRHNTRS